MPVAHKESNLLLDGSGDHSDMVKDETSSETGSCSLSSSSQTCDNILSFKCASSDAAAVRGINSRCAYTDAVLASVTCNESTTDRPRSENMSCVEDCSLEALNKGDISPLVDALGTLDICGSNKIEVEKHTLTISEKECELQKSDSSVHHNQVSKIPCSSKDLLYAIDKATEENVVCKEMKSDNACGLQLRSCNFSYTSMTVGSNMCNHDSHISENSNFPVNDCVNTSPDSCTMNISLPPLDMPFSFNCSENAATPSVFEHKNKIETEHVSLSCGIDTNQSKVNCMMLPSEILMPPAITEFPCGKLEVIKMNVGSEGKKTECCPSESVNVSQTYTDTTGITVISVSKGTAINTTSSIEATETCAMLSGTVSRKLSGTDSMSTSQPDIPQTSVGISSLASHPSPSPPAGSSHCITFISKTDSISDSFTSSLQPQRDSFVKTQNFGSIPSSVTNCNKLFETVADKTEGSVTFSPKGEQNTALGVISSMPASKNSFAEDIPLKLSASPALHNVSRDSSVFSGVHFCTLSSPISSSSVSKPGDTNFHLGTSSSDLEYSLGFGTSLKCGEPCTETFMDTVVSRTGTSLKPDITWSGVNVYSNTMNTSQQNNRLSNTKTKSLDTALISCGTLRFSPLTAQASSSLPNSSVVSIDQLGQVPRIENTALAMSLPNITDEDDNDPSSSWYTIQKSSLKNVAEYTRYSHSSSKPIFGSDFNFLKYESVKDTSVRNNIFGNIFQVNSPGNQSSTANASNMTAFSNGSSTLFRFGSVKMKRDKDFVWEPVTTVASNNFNTDIINKTFTFGIPSPATSSSVLFNSSGSKKTSEHKTELCVQGRSEFHLQRRSSNFAQTGSCFHRTLHKPSALFNVVKDTDTQIENGIVRLIVVQHQHITAMPEYSSLSFEELRLQFYNSKKQTGYFIKRIVWYQRLTAERGHDVINKKSPEACSCRAERHGQFVPMVGT
ncbi:uncharacterized protein LOC110835343 isoform X2 [Zootermopsis nevadensis]|uniref:uncharacterized protein LOC110835343 isoform X2 n=1 Tax=Zootermopsis nevadensis TaxID=136037 RepID=UPI000B8E37FF|nr:uncharacterized protein LOC110835343 isoform X2 [Zootermopsis nevadensis]